MIVLDTSILIDAIQAGNRKTSNERAQKAEAYIQWLSDNGHQVGIPAPALGEFLVAVPPEKMAQTVAELGSKFRILQFDTPAAVAAAEAEQRAAARGIRLLRDGGASKNSAKQQLRIDSQIVGIAIHQQASDIITTDVVVFQALAGGKLKVQDIPTVGSQQIPLQIRGPTDRKISID